MTDTPTDSAKPLPKTSERLDIPTSELGFTLNEPAAGEPEPRPTDSAMTAEASKWQVVNDDDGDYEWWAVTDGATSYRCAWEQDAEALAKHLSALTTERTKLAADLARVEGERGKLQAFKDYVHKRLDEAGIPKEPNGEHSKAGCRVGDRLDIVLAAEAKAARVAEALKELADVVRSHEHDHSNVENEPCPVCCVLVQAFKTLEIKGERA